MLRLLIFLLLVTALALGITQYLEHPGQITIAWLGYEIETSVLFAALALLALVVLLALLWSAMRYLLTRPAAVSRYLSDRREEQGLEALTKGLIAVGAGDRDRAQAYAAQARKRLPNEPLTGLLRAQAAQLAGDREEARRVFEAMAQKPQTELLGLRGLFLEARREQELDVARQFAERAVARNPELSWSVDALFELQTRAGDWEGALKTLEVARSHKQLDRSTADRRRAVLLTAQAQALEDGDADRALAMAQEAHKLAPGLVPAAALAGRLLVAKGSISRAGRLILGAWKEAPHPDLALAYAYLRPGDSPRDRLKRVTSLAEATPGEPEGLIAVATAAVEAHEWEAARAALAPLITGRPPARVCTLMARIEAGEMGDQGRVREWLARAVRAPRDPVWTADGYVSAEWAPVSPLTGRLDAFEWKVPVERIGPPETEPIPEEISLSARVSEAEKVVPPAGEITDQSAGPEASQSPRQSPESREAEPGTVTAGGAEGAVSRPRETTAGDGGPDRTVEQARPAASADATAPVEAAEDAAAGPAADGGESGVFVPTRAPDDPGPEGPASELVEEETLYRSEKG